MTLNLATSAADLSEALSPFENGSMNHILGIDVETTGLDILSDTLLLVQISDGRDTAVIDATRLDGSGRDRLKEFLQKRFLFVTHNAKFEFGWMAHWLGSEDVLPRLYDSFLSERLILGRMNHGGNSLAALAKKYLGRDLSKDERESFGEMEPGEDGYQFTDEQITYAAADAEVLPAIFRKQFAQMTEHGLTEIAKLEFDLIKVVSRMERRGVLIDREAWLAEVEDAKDRCAVLENRMAQMTGEVEFNPRSPKQVKEAFARFGLNLSSTNRKSLEKVIRTSAEGTRAYLLAEAMAEYRKVVVLRDRYGDSWLAMLDPNDRVHAQFNQMGTKTGRFSSSKPNLQQLPRGDRLRKAFVAGPGRKMVTADYSQIEIRLLAEMSGDAAMMEMFDKGIDIHSGTAKAMFRLDEIPGKDSKYRYMAKAVNFGLLYGAGAKNLQEQLADAKPPVKVSLTRAERLIEMYFDQFPTAQKWLKAMDRRTDRSLDDGDDVVARTPGGRRRVFPHPGRVTNFMRGSIARRARNTPIQGGSADITKQAMVRLDRALTDRPNWDAHLLMTVHDEVVVECKAEYADDVAQMVEAKMLEGAAEYVKRCPIKVDVAVDDHWSK